MKTALLISTYNWPDALRLTFESLLLQTVMPDEVLIADDGSKLETKLLINEYKRKFNVPVKHIWHEDNGFQVSAIRNKALKECSSDYIIQIDGDIIMEEHFIEDHIKFSKKNFVVGGSRCFLTSHYSFVLLGNGEMPSKKMLDKNSNNFFNSLRIPLLTPHLANYRTKGRHKYEIKGCNMAFWRQDILEVNGYDERFVGWGVEDVDLLARLLVKGCSFHRIKMSAIQYHIFHKLNSRYNLELNNSLMEKRIEAGTFYAENGIEKNKIDIAKSIETIFTDKK